MLFVENKPELSDAKLTLLNHLLRAKAEAYDLGEHEMVEQLESMISAVKRNG